MSLKNRTNNSIKSAFLKRFIWGALIAWLALSLFSYRATHHEIEELYDGEMAQIGRVLLSIYADRLDVDESSVQITSSPFEGGENYERKLVFQIWSHQGTLLMRSENAPLEALTDQINVFETRILYGNDIRTLAIKDPAGKLVVHIGQNLTIRQENVREILSYLLYILLLALPISIWLIHKGLNKGIAPLKAMSKSISERDEHDLSPIEMGNVPVEIKGIINALNKLMARVEHTLGRERQFVSDAAHELRTPLAGIKAHAQVALKNENHQPDALKNIIRGVDRTSQLANQLLSLSSIDDLKDLGQIDTVNLERLIELVIQDLGANMDEKSITVETHFNASAHLSADKELLYTLLRNLLDNAIRYSPDGSAIRIVTSQTPNTLSLTIVDQGSGIAEDQRERVFDRFYRDINTETQGSGLGLAIALKIARLHRASILLATPQSGQGLSVEVVFKL